MTKSPNWANCIFLPRKFSSNAEVAQVLPEEVAEEVAEVVTKEGEGQGRRGGSAGARARPSPRKGGQGPGFCWMVWLMAFGVFGWFGWWILVAYSCL